MKKKKLEITTKREYKSEIFFKPFHNMEFKSRVFIITDKKVGPLYLNMVTHNIIAKDIDTFIVDGGEGSKSLRVAEEILEFCSRENMDRDTVFIALGGGVIGDLVGFISSVYKRGCYFIQIPTTLLAQVDSSVGGKNAVNNIYSKNIIGTFKQPNEVYIDTNFLDSLDKKEFQSGVAEIIKIATIRDKSFFEFLETHRVKDYRDFSIHTSVKLKLEIVLEDELDIGVRQSLNFGHTFGHAIERDTNYKILHGEAVAIGMVMEAMLANKMGYITKDELYRIKNILANENLDITHEINNIDVFIDFMRNDKKNKNGKIIFALPNGLGDFKIVDNIAVETIREVILEFLD